MYTFVKIIVRFLKQNYKFADRCVIKLTAVISFHSVRYYFVAKYQNAYGN